MSHPSYGLGCTGNHLNVLHAETPSLYVRSQRMSMFLAGRVTETPTLGATCRGPSLGRGVRERHGSRLAGPTHKRVTQPTALLTVPAACRTHSSGRCQRLRPQQSSPPPWASSRPSRRCCSHTCRPQQTPCCACSTAPAAGCRSAARSRQTCSTCTGPCRPATAVPQLQAMSALRCHRRRGRAGPAGTVRRYTGGSCRISGVHSNSHSNSNGVRPACCAVCCVAQRASWTMRFVGHGRG